MNYQALYRVYRPQAFSDVVGQKHVTKTLRNAIQKEKQSHAYLFNGPRGTGKTSIAKIFAKAINCTVNTDGEPCNECAICTGITKGTNSDVIEIDAASNNGVDEIRNIRDKVKYAPSESKFKVYIIDEVHMLTTGAFNALLKTLEEPPSHAIFILATTEPHKIPPTIISRCQRFDFKAINTGEIEERLAYVAIEQGIEYEQDALAFIAHVSEGGMRDALSIMDQAIAFGDGHLSLEHALNVTGSVDKAALNALFNDIVEQDVKRAFTRYHEFIASGKEVNRLVNDMIYFIRDAIVAKTIEQNDEEHALNQIDLNAMYKMIDCINDTLVSMRFAINQNVHIEILIVKLSELVSSSSSTNNQSAQVSNTTSSAVEAKIKHLEEQINQLSQGGQLQKTKPTESKHSVSRKQSKHVFSIRQIERVLDHANRDDLNLLKEKWKAVIEAVKEKEQRALVSLLLNSEPVAASEDHVLVKFDEDIHCEIVNKDDEKRNHIETIVCEIVDKTVKVVGVPNSQWLEVRQQYIQSKKANQSGSEAGKEEEKPEETDIVKKAQELFGKDTVHVTDE